MMSTGDWIAAVSAAATVVAVVAALFGPAVERRLRRPRLVLLAEPPAELGVAAKVVADARADGAVCYWLRLAVSNVGRTTADEVRLLLYRVDVEPPLAVQPPAREAKWADVPQDTLTLPPGITRLVDVLHVVRTRDRRGAVRHGWVTAAMAHDGDGDTPDANLWRELTGPTRMRVHVGLSARDVPPARYEIRLDLTAPDSFQDNETALRQATVLPVGHG